jgi:hypothetical protein
MAPDFFEPFRRGLAEFGFSEGRDVTVEFHNIAGYGNGCPRLSSMWYAEGQRRSSQLGVGGEP